MAHHRQKLAFGAVGGLGHVQDLLQGTEQLLPFGDVAVGPLVIGAVFLIEGGPGDADRHLFAVEALDEHLGIHRRFAQCRLQGGILATLLAGRGVQLPLVHADDGVVGQGHEAGGGLVAVEDAAAAAIGQEDRIQRVFKQFSVLVLGAALIEQVEIGVGVIPQARHQLLLGRQLDQIVVGTPGEGLGLGFRALLHRQHEDRHLAGDVVVAKFAQQLQAAHAAHVHVQQDHHRFDLVGHEHPLGGIGAIVQLQIGQAGDHLADEKFRQGLVVDQQNPNGFLGLDSKRGHNAPSRP